MGNIIEVSENGRSTCRYEYDALGRLTREDNVAFNKTTAWAYDNNGNIIARYEYALTAKPTRELHSLNADACKLYTYADNSDRLMTYNGEAFVYDDIGNPTTYRGKTAVWEYGRQLKSYDGNTFSYDARGRRTAKNSITFTYDCNGNLIKQSNGLEFLYDHTGVFALKYNGSTYFYRKNAQNDIIALLDSNGSPVVKYMYDAWGNCNTTVIVSNASTLAELNPFRYRSYYYDTETGFYFLKTRYYDPEIGRFITIDDISYLDPDSINGLNLYAYCGGNPVVRYDPQGHVWDVILDIVSIIWSAYDFIENPSWANFGWLALDVVFAIVPFLTGSSIMKAASKLDDISDIGGYMNKFDNVYDSIVIGNDMGRVTNLAFDTGSMIYDGYKPLNTLLALGKADEVTDAMRYAAKVDNARFIIDKYRAGYKIINAGSDGRGFFKMMKSAYGMELKILYRLKHGNKLHKLWWVANSGRRLIW